MKKIRLLLIIVCCIAIFVSCDSNKQEQIETQPTNNTESKSDPTTPTENKDPPPIIDIQGYDRAERFQSIVEIEDILYFIRITVDEFIYNSDDDAYYPHIYQHDICSINKDGTDEKVIYSYSTIGLNRMIMKIDNDNIMFFTGYNDTHHPLKMIPSVLNLSTGAIVQSELIYQGYGGFEACNGWMYYIDDYYSEYNSLFRINANFTDVQLIIEDMLSFSVYYNKIMFTKINDDKSGSSLYQCNLDGSNIELIIESSSFIDTEIHNNIVYTSANQCTEVLNLLTGEVDTKVPRILVDSNQYSSNYFIATVLDRTDILKINYEWNGWDDVETIAKYTGKIQLIDDWLYLHPMWENDNLEYNGNAYTVGDGIYRIRVDGSAIEKFVDLEPHVYFIP